MSEFAIQADALGKKYLLGGGAAPYKTLRDLFVFKTGNTRPGSVVWALKDLSVDIKKGEIIGIIGRNGSGKSTFLKLLSRITPPSEGRAIIEGRIASLLEVGTGFHPELSGRENILLNGSIMGMKQREILAKLDSIVNFAEVHKFVDTPVKHYSSGMYLRLAFSIAAHLEPDIMLLDEVLAVGDLVFQKKCFGKMDEVVRSGRTVLFVSHNMAAINRLCGRTIWLDEGRLKAVGESSSVVKAYLAQAENQQLTQTWPDWRKAPGDEFVRLMSVSIQEDSSSPAVTLHQDVPFLIKITYKVIRPMLSANIGFALKTSEGTTVFESFDADSPDWAGKGRDVGEYTAVCRIPPNLLNGGLYYLTLRAGIPFMKVCFEVNDLLKLQIHDPLRGDGAVGRNFISRQGIILPDLDWTVERTKNVGRE